MNKELLLKEKTAADITPEIKAAAQDVLVCRVQVDIIRGLVEPIQRSVLAEIGMKADLEIEDGRPARTILNPRDVFLCTDELKLNRYYQECDKRERNEGIKPGEMPSTHCPLLVAEDILATAKRTLCDAAEPVFGVSASDVLRLGLEKYDKYIDLLCGLVLKIGG